MSKDQLQTDMSKQSVMELNVTRLQKKKKEKEKNASWISRAQVRLACLAVVSSSIQGHRMLCVSLSFHPLFDNSSSISPSPPPLLSMTGVLMITSGGGTN